MNQLGGELKLGLLRLESKDKIKKRFLICVHLRSSAVKIYLSFSPELLASSPFPYTNSPLAIIIDLPPTFTSIPVAPWCAFNSSKEGLPISYPCSTLISIAFSPK